MPDRTMSRSSRRDAGNHGNARYKGTLLGVFWLTATALLTVLGLGLVYSQVFQTSFESYLPYVATGMIVWGLIASLLSEGTGVFSNAHGVFSQVRLPLSIFAYTLIGRAMYAFFFRGLVILPLLLIKGDTVSMAAAGESIGGLLLVFWIGLWTVFPLGLLGARYKDTSQVVAAFVTFAFFLTPIFWQAERLGEYSFLIDFNPLYHFVNVVRGPLLGLENVLLSFIVTIGFAVIMPVIALMSFAAHYRRLPYW